MRRRGGIQRGATRRLTLETLESRRLLAVDVVGALPDIEVGPGSEPGVVPTAGLFAVSGVDVQGTVVRMATQAGATASNRDLFVELFDNAVPGRSAAPVSTANFLSYVDAGRYDDTFFHRATDFAGDTGPARFLQGGGFVVDRSAADSPQVAVVATDAPIALEWAADRPNVAGSIAYARTSDPNSATGGFFFNVTANPSFDIAGNQYAVFGRVIGDGQAILDEYAALPRFDGDGSGGSTFDTLPLAGDATLSVFDRLVVVRSAEVVAVPQAAVGLRVMSSAPAVVSARIGEGGAVLLDYGTQPGEAVVTVTATDLSGASAEASFTVRVADSVDPDPVDPDPSLTTQIVLGGGGPTQLAVVDGDGTLLNLTWRGPGTATFRFAGNQEPRVAGRRITLPVATTLESIALADTTPGSALLAAVSGGDGVIDIERLDATGVVGRINLPRVRIADGLAIDGGVRALTVDGVSGEVTVGGQRIVAASLGSLSSAVVSLPTVGTLRMGAVQDSTIDATANVLTAGAVERSTFDLAGSPRRIAFASLDASEVRAVGAVGTLAVGGTVGGSLIEVGLRLNVLRAGGLADSNVRVGVVEGADIPAAAADFVSGSRLGSLVIAGTAANAFTRSRVAAGVVGRAQLGMLDADPAGTATLVARTAALVAGRGPTGRFVLRRVERLADPAAQLVAAGLDAERLSVMTVG
jgi:cyclophilin family peptidyl-prolyl cis-trans isomerase